MSVVAAFAVVAVGGDDEDEGEDREETLLGCLVVVVVTEVGCSAASLRLIPAAMLCIFRGDWRTMGFKSRWWYVVGTRLWINSLLIREDFRSIYLQSERESRVV